MHKVSYCSEGHLEIERKNCVILSFLFLHSLTEFEFFLQHLLGNARSVCLPTDYTLTAWAHLSAGRGTPHLGLNLRWSLAGGSDVEGQSHGRPGRQILHPGFFSFWVFIKTEVYERPVENLNRLKCCMLTAFVWSTTCLPTHWWNWCPGISCSVTMVGATLKCTDVLNRSLIFFMYFINANRISIKTGIKYLATKWL